MKLLSNPLTLRAYLEVLTMTLLCAIMSIFIYYPLTNETFEFLRRVVVELSALVLLLSIYFWLILVAMFCLKIYKK